MARISPANSFFEFLGGAQGDEAPLIEERQVVAELILIKVMRGYQGGHPRVGHVIDQVPEFPPGHRVDAAGRFVQKEDGRVHG